MFIELDTFNWPQPYETNVKETTEENKDLTQETIIHIYNTVYYMYIVWHFNHNTFLNSSTVHNCPSKQNSNLNNTVSWGDTNSKSTYNIILI